MVSIGLLGFLSDTAIKLIAARVLRWQRGTILQANEG
jgi:NitT/TauT family transport system permease protein